MRIAHINNIAGVAGTLARAQRSLGHEAVVFATQEPPFGFPYDVRIRGAEGPLGWNAAMVRRWRTFSEFDVIHVHGGIWRSQLFYPVFKRAHPRKTLAVHFHGSEARTGKGLHYLRFADLEFVSTMDLRAAVPGALWIPNPVEIPSSPAPLPDNPRPRFGHFPSLRTQKGTERVTELFHEAFGPLDAVVESGVTKLQGKEAELVVGSGIPHAKVLEMMASCDAVVDVINPHEGYGMVAIEAMALGRAVLGTLRPAWYPGCPIVRLGAEDDVGQLREMAANGAYRQRLGWAGREYVALVHGAGKVARAVTEAYERGRRSQA